MDRDADDRRGSVYEYLAGPAAILWAREAARDTDLFAAKRFLHSDGADLTDIVKRRFGIDRYLDTPGTGTAILRRPNNMTSGTIWEGTRIKTVNANNEPQFYVVTNDTVVPAALTDAVVDVHAAVTGRGQIINTTSAVVADALWDNTWQVTLLTCGPGTDFESAEQLKARATQTRLDNRVGYEENIVLAMQDAGAVNVALFRSDYTQSSDYGLNMCYVGDTGYTATDDLILSCRVAADAIAVYGANLQVLPMTTTALSIVADVYLIDDPSKLDTGKIYNRILASLQQYLGGATGGFVYRLDGFRGAVYRVTEEVQEFIINSPAVEGSPTITVDGLVRFPDTLTRYTLSPNDVALTFYGPR